MIKLNNLGKTYISNSTLTVGIGHIDDYVFGSKHDCFVIVFPYSRLCVYEKIIHFAIECLQRKGLIVKRNVAFVKRGASFIAHPYKRKFIFDCILWLISMSFITKCNPFHKKMNVKR